MKDMNFRKAPAAGTLWFCQTNRKRQTMSATNIIGGLVSGNQGETATALSVSVRRPDIVPALEARHLWRKVGDKVLLRDINVRVQFGEVLAVVGQSGSGKSTLLRLLNRLDEPTRGTVLVDGQDYRAIMPRQLRQRVGLVMQMPHLFPGTVAANISYGPQQRGVALMDDQISALLDRVGLPGYQARDVAKLSGGEAQRVSVARTLANDPEVLLLDEPTSALDEASARGIEELLLGIIWERQMACVIVTHNKPQAARIASRTMVLEAGRMVAIGSTSEVLNV